MDIVTSLAQTFKAEYFAFLVNEESTRREIATMIYCFKTNNKHEINRYIAEYMRTSALRNKYAWNTFRYFASNGVEPMQLDMADGGLGMFGEDTIKIMPKQDFELLNKVVNQLCVIYNNGVKRSLVDENGKVNEEQTKLYNQILEDACIGKKQLQYYKDGYVFNTILVQPVWRDKIELDIIAPNFVTVVSEDDNYQKAKIVMVHKYIGDRDEDMLVVWTNEEHYYLTKTGEKIAIKGNDGMKNPYGSIPFAKIQFDESSDYWGEPKQSLVENIIWFNIGEANTFFVEMFQGLGVGLATNTGKSGQIGMKPNTIVAVDNVRKEEHTPKIEFASTNAPLDQLRENSDNRFKKIGNSQGLSAQSFSNEVSTQSGDAKAFDNQETNIIRSTHKVTMIEGEKDIYEKIKIVYNYHNKSDAKLQDGLKLRVDFAEEKPTISLADKIQNNEYRLKNGLASPVDLIMEENPDLTVQEAEKKLLEIKTKIKTYGTQEPVTSGEGDTETSKANTGE